ncbi:MAG: GIY-YIG nuclease family protein [Thermomicrobiales bacterium]
MKQSFVFIIARPSRKTYIGVTADLERRVWEHQTKQTDGHTKQYNKVLLVYIEEFAHIEDAIAGEKQLKKWSSAKKAALVERDNPQWLDLSAEWFR